MSPPLMLVRAARRYLGERSGRALSRLMFALLAVALPMGALAGPPFLTDDPDPVDHRHNEIYVFSTMDFSDGQSATSGPAFEYNRGVWPDVQFHVVLPLSEYAAPGIENVGLGDTEVGIKYRFVQEGQRRPMIGIFPMIELASGNASRGLGNGRTWYHLPIWLQKSSGSWTTYGGGGIDVNHAPGMQNSWFAGWLLQRQVTQRWTLGTEIWHQGAQSIGGRAYTLINTGGYYSFTPSFQLLFTGGHSIAGEQHTVGYLGLYWTWGPE